MRLSEATRRTSIMSMKKTEFVAETPFNRKRMVFFKIHAIYPRRREEMLVDVVGEDPSGTRLSAGSKIRDC